MLVADWGNSLAMRLPAAVVEALRFEAGDDIVIEVVAPRRFEIAKSPTPEALLARLRAARGIVPAGFSIDRFVSEGR